MGRTTTAARVLSGASVNNLSARAEPHYALPRLPHFGMDVRVVLLLALLIGITHANSRCWNVKNGIVCFGKNYYYSKTTDPDGSVQEQMSYSSSQAIIV